MKPSRKFWGRLCIGLVVTGLLMWIALRQPIGLQDDPRLLQRESMMMGTLISLTVYLEDGMPRERGEIALTKLEQFLHQFDQQWSAWGEGELGQLNRALATGQATAIPGAMKPLFAQAVHAAASSNGRFDVRVGELVRLWGFDDEAHYRKQPPSPEDIERLRKALDAAAPLGAERYAAHDIQLDFGAIAKGHAADLAIAQLKRAGLNNAIVNLGGNLRVSGQHGDRTWSIGIQHPRPDQHMRILASLKTHGDEAVITSGDYERYTEFAGQRYHHILDPKTGSPARGLQSVTVIHPQGAWADAASTALFVAGPQHWRETAARMGITQALVVDAQGGVTVTQALAPRLEFSAGIQPVVLP